MASAHPLTRSWRRGLTASQRSRARADAPEWVGRFVLAYTRPARSANALPAPPGLLNAILPAAESARRNVYAAITASLVAPVQGQRFDALRNSLETRLFGRLFAATSPTLALSLGVASIRGLLAGSSPEERYGFFCKCLSDPAFASALLAQYPSLVRRVGTLISHWEAATIEMIERLSRDIQGIRRDIFGGKDPGELVEVESLGDPHAGGRSVHSLTFASGGRLIYKPRSVAMERGVYSFVQWLNGKGLSPDLRAVFVLDQRTYGWACFAEAAPCADEPAVRRYYFRQGGNIALAYLLGATDLHFENVTAAGEYPVIVDLETLFDANAKPQGVGGVSDRAFQILANSVTRTLLLPLRIFGNNLESGRPRGADISALGYVAGQEAPYLGQAWVESGTDAMRLAEQRGFLPPASCLPEVNGQRVPPTAYVDEVVRGFASVYNIFLRNKHALRAKAGGPLEVFKGKTMRHVYRSTAHYMQFLTQSWQPRFASDAVLLETHLRGLLPAPDPTHPSARAIRNAELVDLMNGDIPCFRGKVGRRSIHTAKRSNSNMLLRSTGWHACKKRMEALSPADKERQIWITRMSLVRFDTPLERTSARSVAASPKAIKAAASRIGDRLCDLAICKDGRASWLFPMLDNESHLAPAVAGFDLYDGLAGIALFLGRLACETKKRLHRQLAAAAVAEALSIYRRAARYDPLIGAFDGAGGLAYALALLGRWLARPDWRRKSTDIVRAHAGRAADDAETDLIVGRAGFLASATAVAEITGDRALVNLLRPCAESLRALAPDALPPEADAGLAHGKSGIGFALARWAGAAGEPKTFEAAYAWLEADIAAAEKARSAMREPERTPNVSSVLAWCRGGIGTALAASRLHHPARHASEKLVRDTVATLADPPNDPALCVCHGLFGVLEFLEAARDAGVDGAEPALQLLRGEALARVFAGELCADHNHRLETPGLMKGIAGTGYALLRMLHPDCVPSVLTLEPY